MSNSVVMGGGSPSIEFASGEGVWVRDPTGRRYLDCTAQSWALYLGHSNPEVRAYANEVMARGWHVHQGLHTQQREDFAEALLARANQLSGAQSFTRVAFTATSALSIETALKLAMLRTPDRVVLGRLRGGFHGTTLGVAQLSWPATDDVPPVRRTLDAFANIGPRVTSFAFPMAEDPDASLVTLEDEVRRWGTQLLAVVVEPIQGSGGQREVPTWWLEALLRWSELYGFVVIFDEIQTYMRPGRMFTLSAQLRPHYVCLGKGISCGFNAGAVLLREDMAGFPGGTHDLHTFGSSYLSHSMGVKLIEITERDHLLHNALERGEQIRAAVQALEATHRCLATVRQVGLHVGVPIVHATTGLADPAAAARLRRAAQVEGLLLGIGGYDPSVVKIKPPLTITATEVDELSTLFENALRRVNHD